MNYICSRCTYTRILFKIVEFSTILLIIIYKSIIYF
nr:MAG TPA: hypothetical protein [Crassvirales sp.]